MYRGNTKQARRHFINKVQCLVLPTIGPGEAKYTNRQTWWTLNNELISITVNYTSMGILMIFFAFGISIGYQAPPLLTKQYSKSAPKHTNRPTCVRHK